MPSVRDVLMSVPNERAFREDVRRPEVADVAGALSIANDDIAASLSACAVGKAEVAEFLWRQWGQEGLSESPRRWLPRPTRAISAR